MTRRLRAFVGAASLSTLAAAAALAAAPAALAGDPCYHGYTIPASTTVSTSSVNMEPCAFVPTNVRVAPGTTVTFKNGSQEVHLLTGANQAWGDREKELAPGASLSVTFDTPGVYAFSCALHRGMSGAVIVEEGEAVAAAAPVSDTGSGDGTAAGLLGTGMATTLAIVALAMVALAGWGTVVAQRRRAVA